MTNTYNAVEITTESDDQLEPAAAAPIWRRSLRERGMVTIEYAIGIVLVVAMVGVMIVTIKSGTFSGFVNQIIAALAQAVQAISGT